MGSLLDMGKQLTQKLKQTSFADEFQHACNIAAQVGSRIQQTCVVGRHVTPLLDQTCAICFFWSGPAFARQTRVVKGQQVAFSIANHSSKRREMGCATSELVTAVATCAHVMTSDDTWTRLR